MKGLREVLDCAQKSRTVTRQWALTGKGMLRQGDFGQTNYGQGNDHLYVDEFQNFATESFATILSEAAMEKYRLTLTVAN